MLGGVLRGDSLAIRKLVQKLQQLKKDVVVVVVEGAWVFALPYAPAQGFLWAQKARCGRSKGVAKCIWGSALNCRLAPSAVPGKQGVGHA